MQRLLVVFGIILTVSIWADVRVPPGTDDAVRDRLTPFGSSCKAGEECAGTAVVASGGEPLSGQAVYDKSCFICHAAGVGGAPKFQNIDDWKPRLAKGLDTLWSSTQNGLNAGMPPKGTCMDCSDDELRAAMDYMIDAVK
ncbi:MAG: c-type cytochrome [Pseudomonadales bacterium]|nr:c-type cytochrome [Pseudomonadales bacterium]